MAALATVGLLALLSYLPAEQPSGDENQPAAAVSTIDDLAFLTDQGATATLADYHGEPLVVNFFASWCPPCRAELPDFEAVHQDVGDRVTFLGVNQDFTEDTWKAFVAETTVTYQTVFQPNSEIWLELDTNAMPTTAFISPDGEIVRVWAGPLTDEKLAELVDETLLEKS